MTYQIKCVIEHPGHPPRELTVRIAGCQDETQALEKLRTLYPVRKVKQVVPVPA